MTQKDTVILYHGDCSDGFGGAWAAWKKFGDKAEYIGVTYDNPAPKDIIGKEIYFIDYSYKPDAMKDLIAKNRRVTSIDHHISAEAAIKLTKDYSYALDHSGCVLAWKYFHPRKTVPKMLLYIEDNDIGKWTLPWSRAYMIYIQSFKQDFKIWSSIIAATENSKTRKGILETGKTLLRLEQSLVERVLSRNSELVEFEGHKVYAVNSSLFPTQIGKAIVERHPPMGIIWNKIKNQYYVSLRSDKTVDVSKIAEKYGGGGHKQASGFYYPADKPLPWKSV